MPTSSAAPARAHIVETGVETAADSHHCYFVIAARSRGDASGRHLREAAALLRAAAGVRIAMSLPPADQADSGHGDMPRGRARMVEFHSEAPTHAPALRELAKAYDRGERGHAACGNDRGRAFEAPADGEYMLWALRQDAFLMMMRQKSVARCGPAPTALCTACRRGRAAGHACGGGAHGSGSRGRRPRCAGRHRLPCGPGPTPWRRDELWLWRAGCAQVRLHSCPCCTLRPADRLSCAAEPSGIAAVWCPVGLRQASHPSPVPTAGRCCTTTLRRPATTPLRSWPSGTATRTAWACQSPASQRWVLSLPATVHRHSVLQARQAVRRAISWSE